MLRELTERLSPDVRFATTSLSWFAVASDYEDPYWHKIMIQPPSGPGKYHKMLAESRLSDEPILQMEERGPVIRVIIGDGLNDSTREELLPEIEWLRNAQRKFRDFHVFPVLTDRNCNVDLLVAMSVHHELTDCRDKQFPRLMKSVHALTHIARQNPEALKRVRSLGVHWGYKKEKTHSAG